MKCIYCNQKQEPNTIGGLIYINCCTKIQILKSSVRPMVLKSFQPDENVILIDQEPLPIKEQMFYN